MILPQAIIHQHLVGIMTADSEPEHVEMDRAQGGESVGHGWGGRGGVMRQEEVDKKGAVNSICFTWLQLSPGALIPCVPSMGPGVLVLALLLPACGFYLLQICFFN